MKRKTFSCLSPLDVPLRFTHIVATAKMWVSQKIFVSKRSCNFFSRSGDEHVKTFSYGFEKFLLLYILLFRSRDFFWKHFLYDSCCCFVRAKYFMAEWKFSLSRSQLRVTFLAVVRRNKREKLKNEQDFCYESKRETILWMKNIIKEFLIRDISIELQWW